MTSVTSSTMGLLPVTCQNIWKSPFMMVPMAIRNKITTVGRMQGSVIYLIFCHMVAPSRSAASNISPSMFTMLARYITVPYPTFLKALTTISITGHAALLEYTSSGFIPTDRRKLFTAPNS